MKIVVSGGTGFIGEPLVRELLSLGEVVVLTRNPQSVSVGRGVKWDASPGGAWESELGDADAAVNLAGESIAGGRWTKARKKRLLESRLSATAALVGALRKAPPRQRVLVSASGINYYGDRGDEILEEGSGPGDDFLARVCLQWEEAAQQVGDAARLVIGRFGIVLERDGGALPQMALPFRLFAGGRVGSGEQWMSWVHRRDVVRFLRWAVENGGARGQYNVTAPEPVRNRDFTKELAAALHRPALVPAPAFALRLALGEMADSLLLGSYRVVPSHAVRERFAFEYGALESALESIYGKR